MVGGRDRNGTPIAKDDDGTMWKFVFLFCENDFDMDAEHGLPNSKRAYLFCKHCLATNITKRGEINPHPYNDGGPNASWRNHLVTSNTEFMHRIVRRHPLTDSKYFNRYTCRNDLMHGMDHKGVYGVIFASVVLYLVYNDGEPTLGATQPERLNTVNHRLDKFYSEGGVSNRLDQLEMKNLSSDGPATYAALCGPTVKAANTRHAMPFLKDLANRHLTSATNADHVIIHQLLNHTMEFHRLSYSSGTFFTPEDLAAYDEAAKGMGKYMQLLRKRAKEAKQLLWHITPKTHFMQHFPQEARLISPRVVQCYIEESYIGKIAQIWASSKNGPYGETIQSFALLKYLVWLCIELDL